MLILHVGALFPAKLFLILTNSKDYNGSNFDFNINIHSHTNAYLQVITFQYIYEIEFKNFFQSERKYASKGFKCKKACISYFLS